MDMDIVLLKATCKKLSSFSEGILDIDFTADKRVYDYEKEENIVSHLFNSIYKLNSMAFVGINAAGKTTALNIISSILDIYIGNASLKYDMTLNRYFDDLLEIETYYFQKEEKAIYKIYSLIKKDSENKSVYFKEETLYKKKITGQTNKNNIYHFDESNKTLSRKKVDSDSMVFLKKEDSIFSSIMNKNDDHNTYIFDMCQTTNHNYLSNLSQKLMIPFVNYLDSSIESLEATPKKSPPTIEFTIKFKGNSGTTTVDYGELDDYLSSGTIKGISCLSNIVRVFKGGGYLIIDEIENHFNKSIVINIIRMFSSSLNNSGATLIFSTHYSEILDSIDRSDSIYVLNKTNEMSIKKFSKIASSKDRKDKKRSDLYLSGELNSAPSYKAYRALIESLREHLNGVIDK